jgi:hypothetical protein
MGGFFFFPECVVNGYASPLSMVESDGEMGPKINGISATLRYFQCDGYGNGGISLFIGKIVVILIGSK